MINLLKRWFGGSTVDLDPLAEKDIRNVNSHNGIKHIPKDRIFEDIYGHDLLKMIFRKAINNDTHESMNILLTGSRGTGKTLFLDCIKKILNMSILYLM